MNAWTLVVIAGLLEVAWAVGLKQSDGFGRLGWSVFTVVAMIASFLILAAAMKELPMGTAYAVWVGIGVAGTTVVGMVVLGEPFSWLRAGFVTLLIIALAGLKLTAPA